MKKLFLICLIALTSINADKYLISEGKIGGYLGFFGRHMQIDGKTTSIPSGNWMLVVDDTYSIGFGSHLGDKEKKGAEHRFDYSALHLGWNYSMSSYYNPYILILLGAGSIDDKETKYIRDNTFDFKGLSLGVQIKITTWFRIAPFIGYTNIQFDKNSNYKDSDFGGLDYGVQFNFGTWRK